MIKSCDCPLAGYCERHKMIKTEHLHHLCQTDERYRDLWDKKANGEEITPKKEPQKLPSVWQQAKNLGKAVVKHAANLFQIAPDSVIEMRKSICDSCDKLNPERRCSECGCYVDVKTKWASEECPLKKWMAYAAEKKEDLGELKKGGCNCGR